MRLGGPVGGLLCACPCVSLLLVGACQERPRPTPAAASFAVGEPVGTYPSPEERLLVALTNRARSSPSTIHGACPGGFYNPPPLPPLGWDYDLDRSARFQATHLALADCTIMHTSCCTLRSDVGTSGCDGDPTCACSGPVNCPMCALPGTSLCGTDPFTRIGYFYTSGSANAENAAAGYADAWSAFAGWIDECADPSNPAADGHRQAILNATSNQVGCGAINPTTAACWSSFYFQDFGVDSSFTVPELPAGSVNPTVGPPGGFDFYLNYWAPTGPASVQVVVDGACTPMALEVGAPTNGTFKATASLAGGCHQYWFLVHDGAGARVTYPTTGALTVAAGSTCAATYVPGATPASCEAPTTDARIPRADSAGAARDLALPRESGASMDDAGGARGDASDAGAAGKVGAGCGCDLGGPRRDPEGWTWLAVGLALAWLASRRRLARS